MGGIHVVEPPEDGNENTESTATTCMQRAASAPDVLPTSALLVEEPTQTRKRDVDLFRDS